jgi:hypothetical protein
MELAPYDPSFLDMRNAILVADTAVFHGDNHPAIWHVFAHRGMGFFAGTLGAGDSQPAPSFATPPATVATGTIQGHVSGDPVPGLTVTLAFQGSGTVNPTTTTDSSGDFTLTDIPQGHYAKLLVRGAGYSATRAVTVGSGTTTVDFP